MTISLIVAVADNNVIGCSDGDIPWRIKTDFLFFRRATMSHPLIMGRKTFCGPPINGKALTGRMNIVLTRDESFIADGSAVVHDPDAALELAAAAEGGSEIFIAGGAEIYGLFLAAADRLYLTRVNARPDGDTYFTFDATTWREVRKEVHPADLSHGDQYAFTFFTYERRRS